MCEKHFSGESFYDASHKKLLKVVTPISYTSYNIASKRPTDECTIPNIHKRIRRYSNCKSAENCAQSPEKIETDEDDDDVEFLQKLIDVPNSSCKQKTIRDNNRNSQVLQHIDRNCEDTKKKLFRSPQKTVLKK